ncbi:MAG: acetate/propionate family kinase [Pseudomonadota bacterium]
MNAGESSILAINGGSSTIRFALFPARQSRNALLRGKVDRIGSGDMTLTTSATASAAPQHHGIGAGDHAKAVDYLLTWLQSQPWFATVAGVGHRVVHGMHHTEPELITPDLVRDLERIMPFDPLHLPRELALIAALEALLPGVPQVACFDTAFHRSMPQVAKLLPIPRRYQAAGVERYGFHGLSYAYCMDELQQCGDPAAHRGRVILAHLGSGASLAAVNDGRSIDTSMAFTSEAGIPMSTRSGDLDPGLGHYLAETEKMSAAQFQHMVSHESGLLGISETSADVRELLALEGEDTRAAEAIALFCYQVKKWIGSFAAALGGVDTLVFAGGIGENSPPVRGRICAGLEFLGVELDASRNASSVALISTAASRVAVRVVRTDEEIMLARAVWQHLENS